MNYTFRLFDFAAFRTRPFFFHSRYRSEFSSRGSRQQKANRSLWKISAIPSWVHENDTAKNKGKFASYSRGRTRWTLRWLTDESLVMDGFLWLLQLMAKCWPEAQNMPLFYILSPQVHSIRAELVKFETVVVRILSSSVGCPRAQHTYQSP